MKRFYKAVAAGERDGAFTVLLDGRPVRTPGKAYLLVPTKPLAEAVAAEWQAQKVTIEPAQMPLTLLAATALDRVASNAAGIAASVARFAETDLVCYRADTPDTLAQRQRDAWSPLVIWLEQRFAAKLVVTNGIQPIPQSAASIAAIQAAVARYEPFPMAALSSATTTTGSVAIGLALVERHVSASDAADAAQVDEVFQMERWGSDAEAERRLARQRSDLEAAEHFLSLL